MAEKVLISKSELLKEFDPNGDMLDRIWVRSKIVSANGVSEQEIRAKAIDEFFEELRKYECDDNWLRLKMSSIYEIAEKLRGERYDN